MGKGLSLPPGSPLPQESKKNRETAAAAKSRSFNRAARREERLARLLMPALFETFMEEKEEKRVYIVLSFRKDI